MKIVVIGPAYPLRGGIADFNTALCKSFEKKGCDCVIVSFSMQYPRMLFPGQTQFLPKNTPAPDIKIYQKINSINPLSWVKTIKFIKKINPDLIITAYWLPFTGLSTAVILKNLKKKIPTIALAHNIIPHDRKPGDKFITSFFVKQNKAFVVLSDAVSKELDLFDKNARRIVVPHPVYDIFGQKIDKKTALEKLEIPDGKYALFFGLIKKYKGLMCLLQAFADEKLKNSDIKLIIAGEFYDNKDRYLEFIEENDLHNKIILKDYFIPTEEVKYYFSAADVAVLPYSSATQSGVTQVAFHFDTPVIVSDVGGLKEIVADGKAGYIVPPNNPQQLSEKILKFFAENKKTEFSEYVAIEKQKYTWDNFSDKILSLFEEVKNADKK